MINSPGAEIVVFQNEFFQCVLCFCSEKKNPPTALLIFASESQIWCQSPLKAMKGASVSLTLWLSVFQSIEREEPIEVDPAPTYTSLENGHTAATGNNVTSALQPASRCAVSYPEEREYKRGLQGFFTRWSVILSWVVLSCRKVYFAKFELITLKMSSDVMVRSGYLWLRH